MGAIKRKSKNGKTKLNLMDLVSTGPGTLAGRFMRKFWHPVYQARNLPVGQARPIKIMSEEFTLYRSEDGTPHILEFRCPHRGTQLSVGWVEGDCIRCIYHGWLFDGSGQCVEQPAEEKAFAKKVRIQSYPTREYLGHIFAYFGVGKPPTFPRFPNFEKEGLLEILPVQVWPCNFFQRVDNNGDTVHVPFVHRKAYSAVKSRSGIPTLTKKESDWGTTAYATFPGGWTNIFQFVMPNGYTFRNPSPDPELAWEDRIQWDVPLDDTHSLEFRARLVPVTGEAARQYHERRSELYAEKCSTTPELGEAVLLGKLQYGDLVNHAADEIALVHTQDYVAQVGQGIISDRKREQLGRSDVGVILFRKIWERELRAFSEGRNTKKWICPQDRDKEFKVGRQE